MAPPAQVLTHSILKAKSVDSDSVLASWRTSVALEEDAFKLMTVDYSYISKPSSTASSSGECPVSTPSEQGEVNMSAKEQAMESTWTSFLDTVSTKEDAEVNVSNVGWLTAFTTRQRTPWWMRKNWQKGAVCERTVGERLKYMLAGPGLLQVVGFSAILGAVAFKVRQAKMERA